MFQACVGYRVRTLPKRGWMGMTYPSNFSSKGVEAGGSRVEE